MVMLPRSGESGLFSVDTGRDTPQGRTSIRSRAKRDPVAVWALFVGGSRIPGIISARLQIEIRTISDVPLPAPFDVVVGTSTRATRAPEVSMPRPVGWARPSHAAGP